MPRSSKPLGQLGKEVEILPGTQCVFLCVCERELGDPVGVQELIFSQRGNHEAKEFICSQDNKRVKTAKCNLTHLLQ